MVGQDSEAVLLLTAPKWLPGLSSFRMRLISRQLGAVHRSTPLRYL
jgi:hypothetical protein